MSSDRDGPACSLWLTPIPTHQHGRWASRQDKHASRRRPRRSGCAKLLLPVGTGIRATALHMHERCDKRGQATLPRCCIRLKAAAMLGRRRRRVLEFVEEHHFDGSGVAVPFASLRQRRRSSSHRSGVRAHRRRTYAPARTGEPRGAYVARPEGPARGSLRVPLSCKSSDLAGRASRPDWLLRVQSRHYVGLRAARRPQRRDR